MIIGAAAAATLMLSACDSVDGENKSTVTYPAVNLITTTIPGGTTVASHGAYTFTFNYSDQTETVGTGALIYDNQNHGFSTNAVKYKDLSPSRGMGIYASGFQANVDNNPMRQLSDCQFYVSSFPIPEGMDYVPSKAWIPKVKVSDDKDEYRYHEGAMYVPGYAIPPIVTGSYKVGNELDVTLFTTDASFFGTTETTFPGGTYSSGDIIYRIFIDVKKNKADLVLYNAKFADKAPVLPVIYVPGLDVTFSKGNYVIKGENIIPRIPEGSDKDTVNGSGQTTTENPKFIFNEFRMETVPGTLMSTVDVEYKVAGIYEGQFRGKYVELPALMTSGN